MPETNAFASRSDYDLLAIGCGPFNLGLAALAYTVDDMSFVAVDASDQLRWHPGLMLDDAVLQVGFLADLVSLVEPTHPLSFLAYLQDRDRMYPFYVRERFHMTRREYEDYIRWAADRLDSIRFSTTVESVEWNADRGSFDVAARGPAGASKFRAKNIAVGIGTEPAVTPALSRLPRSRLVHSADYLHRRADIDGARRITVVGSGQSGAEVVLDLLRRSSFEQVQLSWLTRTPAFAPLDYTKLVLEMTTPDYVRYFHGLDEKRRDQLVADQWRHYKGISEQTIEDIHDQLYRRLVDYGRTGVELRCGVAVEAAAAEGDAALLTCRHADTGSLFHHATDVVIAATGYRHREARFLAPLAPDLLRDASGRLRINLDHSAETRGSIDGKIFISNGDLHSHGVAAPDLGICAYRNAIILNQVCGKEVYRLPQRTALSSFAAPSATPITRSSPETASRPDPFRTWKQLA